MIRIRDPLHGSIALTPAELVVVESRPVQRLRHIKQLGFTDQAFPGATHTRFAHALGALEMATRMFDAALPAEAEVLPAAMRARFRQLVRLGLLLHDTGHPPASHAGEMAMPRRHTLGLPGFTTSELEERATHEDYSLGFLLNSPLKALIEQHFPDDVTPMALAHLISGRFPEVADLFVHAGIDYFPLLTQMVSGELDADRMDYLQRDAYHAGVTYGRYDQGWLLENLTHHVVDHRACLALSHRAVFAFEDFLLGRYHMFVSIYYHHVPVGFETMLLRFLAEEPDAFALPADAEAYEQIDDVTMWTTLRQSSNTWAQRIAYRRPFRRILELNADPLHPLVPGVLEALQAEGITCFESEDQGVLSKYYGTAHGPPIYVVHEAIGQAVPIQRYARVYARYAQPTRLARIYVDPKQAERARAIVGAVVGEISLSGAVFG